MPSPGRQRGGGSKSDRSGRTAGVGSKSVERQDRMRARTSRLEAAGKKAGLSAKDAKGWARMRAEGMEHRRDKSKAKAKEESKAKSKTYSRGSPSARRTHAMTEESKSPGGYKSKGKRGSAGGKVSRRGRLGVGWLRTSGTEEDLGKTNKELRAERKTYTDKSGPVRKATKAEKAKMQRKLDKEAGKKTTKLRKSKKSDASKTPGETKSKRTGGKFRAGVSPIGGGGGMRGGR